MTEDEFFTNPIDVDALTASIVPLLRGHPPGNQGGSLAQLLAMWLAGHPDFVRIEILRLHIEHVRRLVPIMERELFAGGRHPGSRRG